MYKSLALVFVVAGLLNKSLINYFAGYYKVDAA